MVVLDTDPPCAYPIRILSYHEVVNETVDDTPVAITWCPICWSAVVYERTVGDRTLEFGVSGKLADDDLVLYDRETESEWKQSNGVCIAGELEGEELQVVPSTVTTWEEFEGGGRNGIVLQPAGRDFQSYEMAPYRRYFEAPGFGAEIMRGTGIGRSWNRGDLDPKAVVLGIQHGDRAIGYPRPRVTRAGGIVTDTVDGLDIVVVAPPDDIHAFEDPGYEFKLVDGELHGDGAVWDCLTGESDDGRQLVRVPARRMFAFAWQDDHGPDSVYRAP